jgi:hypothetical protein
VQVRAGREQTIAGVVAVLLVGEACGGVGLPDDERWSSEHFVFHTRNAERDACADILPLLEQHFATMQAFLGFTWPQGRVIDYYKFVDQGDLNGHSDCTAVACGARSRVESASAFDPYDLIHAYLAPTGDPMPLIADGTALAVTCAMANWTRSTASAETVLGLADTSPDLYSAGGWLVSYLIDQFGPAKLLEIYGQLPPGSTEAQADALFTTVYGVTFADVWGAASAEETSRNVCPWECSQPAIAIDGGPQDTQTGACGQSYVERTFSATAGENVIVSSDGAGFGVGSCGPHADIPAAYNVGGVGGASIYNLPGGDYFLDYSSQPGTITLASASDTALATSCPAGATGAVAGFDTVSLFVPRSAQSWFLPIGWSPGRSVFVNPSTAGARAFLCPSCATDPELCPVAQDGVYQPLTSVGDIRFDVDPSVPMSAFILLVR